MLDKQVCLLFSDLFQCACVLNNKKKKKERERGSLFLHRERAFIIDILNSAN